MQGLLQSREWRASWPFAYAPYAIPAASRQSFRPQDLQRLQILAQDPRPLQDKQAMLAQELEATLADLVGKGLVVEADALAQLKPLLPEQLWSALPQELTQRGPATPMEARQQAEVAIQEEGLPLTMEQTTASQAAQEVFELKEAVTSLKDCLAALRSSTEPSQAAVLRLNVRDARDSLNRRLQQLSPVTVQRQEVPINSASQEASRLLLEVDAAMQVTV